jgi:hypothetical protein
MLQQHIALQQRAALQHIAELKRRHDDEFGSAPMANVMHECEHGGYAAHASAIRKHLEPKSKD